MLIFGGNEDAPPSPSCSCLYAELVSCLLWSGGRGDPTPFGCGTLQGGCFSQGGWQVPVPGRSSQVFRNVPWWLCFCFHSLIYVFIPLVSCFY